MSGDKTVAEVRKRLAATPEKVFAAFSDAALVGKWLTPAPGIKLTVMQFDFRVGGTYRFAYHLPEGTVVTIGGTFRSIGRPTTIVFSWIIEPPDEHAGIASEVTVTIASDRDGGSELVIRHEKLRRSDAVSRHAEGWRGALKQLAELVEAEGAAA